MSFIIGLEVTCRSSNYTALLVFFIFCPNLYGRFLVQKEKILHFSQFWCNLTSWCRYFQVFGVMLKVDMIYSKFTSLDYSKFTIQSSLVMHVCIFQVWIFMYYRYPKDYQFRIGPMSNCTSRSVSSMVLSLDWTC